MKTDQPVETTAARRAVETELGKLLVDVARETRTRLNRRWVIAATILLALILGGMISMQVQLYGLHEGTNDSLSERCQERNRQAGAVAKFAAQMAGLEVGNHFIDEDLRAKRVEAYENLAAAYGETLDCSIYR